MDDDDPTGNCLAPHGTISNCARDDKSNTMIMFVR